VPLAQVVQPHGASLEPGHEHVAVEAHLHPWVLGAIG
jgi:hypothetical protein